MISDLDRALSSSAQIKTVKRQLVRHVKAMIASMRPSFYSSGYVDKREKDWRFKLAKLDRPIRVRMPGCSRCLNHSSIAIQYLSCWGYLPRAYGGGAVFPNWEQHTVEELAAIARAIARHLGKCTTAPAK